MARKSFDPTPIPEPRATTPDRRDAPVFLVAPDDQFLARVQAEIRDLPEGAPRHRTIPELSEALRQFDRISLAFVVIAQERGADVDVHALRSLRLDFPQVILLAILETCEQRDSLRLQSIGVHSVLLPPFEEVSLSTELSTAMPNVSRFKRNADLMRRAQARIDFLIPSDLSYVLGVNHEISTLLREFGFPLPDTRVNIPLACDEAITNAILHGNGGDPEKKVKYGVAHAKHRTDYNLYEGWELVGYPEKVFLRGRLIVENEQWLGKRGMGQFLRRGEGEIL